ncbi:MAG: ABC transporter substrate-binding protein [Anaerolineae bacterium]|nr:ABC transporter substrate-binding protein [Anaerolineae bacterium]MDW8101139.1 ABC transporter substrate-binding protein [Anaerolineae bacterium]
MSKLRDTLTSQRLTRRELLKFMGVSAVGMALAACAPAAPAPAAPAAPAEEKQEEAPAAAPEAKGKYEYWTGWSGFEFDALQAIVDKFNAAHPDIAFNMTTVFGQYDKVLTAIAGGTPPDVVSAVWLHELVSMAARKGLMAITSYAERDGITGEPYFPNLWDAWHWNGELWGLAITANSNVIAYRKDLFREVGLDPEKPPKTIAELDVAAQKLDKFDENGNILRYGIYPSGIWWWGNVFGGTFFDEQNNKITANDEKIVAALDWMGGYAKRLDPTKVAAFQQGFGDYMSPQNAFFVGKEAMTQVGEWFISFVDKFAPGLEYDFIPAPVPEGGREMCTTFGGSIFTIPNGVKNPDASWEFIKFLSEDENMGEFCYVIHNVPPKIAVAYQERFIGDPKFKLAVDMLSGKNSFGPPKTPVTSFYFTKLGEAEDAVKQGQKTAKEALDEVVDLVTQELERAMKRG